VMPIVFMAIFEAILVGVVLSSLVCALPYSAHNVQGANKYQRPSRQLASSFSLYPSIEGEPEMVRRVAVGTTGRATEVFGRVADGHQH